MAKILKHDGVYLHIQVTPKEFEKIPEAFKNQTYNGNVMLLGNTEEDSLIASFGINEKDCYTDYYIIHKEKVMTPTPKITSIPQPEMKGRKTKGCERNRPCPCGSGKKFKKCHMGMIERGF